MKGEWGVRYPLLLLTVALWGCGAEQSILGSDSPGAAAIEGLWWISLVGTGGLSTLVIAGLFVAIRRARHASDRHPRPADLPPRPSTGAAFSSPESRFILLAGVGMPLVFLVGFLSLSVRTAGELLPPAGEDGLTIEVIGHKFWWEVRYPDLGITTANEIHIPTGTVVHVEVTSADVIHSFWVPQLSPGKVDMVPGRTNTIWMYAAAPGRHRGQCTEFCGLQHALMSLSVQAHEPDRFTDWVGERTGPPTPPSDPDALRGVSVFFTAGCASCHAIEGVRAADPRGMAGPDLSHLASRETLGALTIPNDREHLTAWIVDPHQFKPGVRMPPTRLPAEELAALVSYLESLD